MPIQSIVEAYRVLEIHTSSSQSEIKSAYKRLALKTHPDKNRNDPNANAKFQQVTEAFQMLMRFDSVHEDSDDLDDDEEDDDFRPADLPEVVFRFFFKRSGTTFSSFDTTKDACNCVNCQFQRFFEYLAKQRTGRAAPDAPFRSSSYVPQSTYRTTPASASRPPNFDPHADWLSEGEGEVKASKPKKFKKCSKKKKPKKSTASRRRELPLERKTGGSEEGSSGSSDQGASDSSSNESSVSSISADNVPVDRTPVPEFVLPSEANGSVQPSAPPITPKKTAFKLSIPEPSPKLNSKRGRKAAARKNKSQKSPRTPTTNAMQGSPRTPNSLATTHVGSYSAPNTPSNARVKTAAKDTPKTEKATTRTKQPYVVPTLPTLEGVQLCRIFLLKHGKCRFGDKCKFSHGVAPGAALAASESEDGVAISSSSSPVRSGYASTSPPPPPPSPAPITLSPKAPRSSGRAQVTVNPSIGGFGRIRAPKDRAQSNAARHQSAPPVLEVPRAAPARPLFRHQSQSQSQSKSQVQAQAQRANKPQAHAQHLNQPQQSRFGGPGNRYEVLSSDEPGDAGAHEKPRVTPVCAFYNTPNGCAYGKNCRFAHDLR